MFNLAQLPARIENTVARLTSGPTMDVSPTIPIVSFTFDDVPETALSAGAPILERKGVAGTFYIAGGPIKLRDPERGLITPEHIQELHARGHEIGDHTFSHLQMRRFNRAGIACEFQRNAEFLREIDEGIVPRNMAFPYNQSAIAATSELRRRFRSARGGRAGVNRRGTRPLHLQAVEIAPHLELARLTRWIDDVAARPGWLIFFTHDVSDCPTRFGTTAAVLERLVDYALARGCLALTVDAALDRIGAPTAMTTPVIRRHAPIARQRR